MDDLLIKYLLEEVTPDEKARVDEWLSADDRNRQRYEEFRTAWLTSRRTVTPAIPDRQEALERFRQRRSMAAVPPAVPAVTRSLRPWRAVAILSGLLAAGGATWMVLKQPGDIPVATTKAIVPVKTAVKTAAAPGWNAILADDDVRTDTLPDGTIVTLNRQAHIAYLTGLKDKKDDGRTIRLEGEAFFVVAPDASHPFIVRANDITVKVLGTSFNVSSRPGSTEVIVETGAVRVSRVGDSLLLPAGYKTTALPDQGRLVATINRDKAYTGYRHAFVLPKKIPHPAGTAQARVKIVRSILTDLVRYKVIPDENSITWFALDYGQFIVDDRPMPDSLHALFNTKYMQPDSLGYYYGSVKVHGKGYFFEKKDLNQEKDRFGEKKRLF